ncbi:hypothetical protein [Nonomuraea sp. NPDC049309]|uniref:hypothetical protein n=1 Tax=Nonomuraea sp. NPDC049309 TaxID=3364350 RepID=UPI00372163F0
MVSNGSGEREHGTGSAPYGMGDRPRSGGAPSDVTPGSLFTSNVPAGGGGADAPGGMFAAGDGPAGGGRRGRPGGDPLASGPGGAEPPGSLFMSGSGRHGGGPAGPGGPGGGGRHGGGPAGPPPQGGFGPDAFGGPGAGPDGPERRPDAFGGPGTGTDGFERRPPAGAPNVPGPNEPTSAFSSPSGPDGGKGADDKKDKKGGKPSSRRGRKDRGAAAEDTGGDDRPAKTAQNNRIGWSPYDENSRSRGPLLAGIGGLVVLGLLTGGLVMMYNADDPVTAETTASRQTSAPLPSVPPGRYGFAASRKTDPDPISVKEIFGKKRKFTVSKRGYEMTITSKDKQCTDGALGDALQKALKSAKCTQFVRASFRDKEGVVIGTIGVANLSSEAQAKKVAKAGSTSNYVKPLAGKDEVTKQLGSGAGGAKISTYGHYAILVWFQRKDGTKPDSKGSKRISQAIVDITKATVYEALDNRALTGSALS